MQEILGKNLQCVFNSENLIGEKTYSGKEFEVWEIPDKTYEILSGMPDDDFCKLYPLSEWHFALGSNMDKPYRDYIINNQSIKAWDGETRKDWEDDECMDCSDRLEGNCNSLDEDICCCFHNRCYNTLTDYFANEIGVGLLRNICALSIDLAKYNNMTLGELFTKFEGE